MQKGTPSGVLIFTITHFLFYKQETALRLFAALGEYSVCRNLHAVFLFLLRLFAAPEEHPVYRKLHAVFVFAPEEHPIECKREPHPGF
ncbi:hypothetical protein [Dyadobacter flavalbus]|uniref:hypothetical protein n=1 Tax=Dyadobacter flavalbus TaxID=2579942 RepID=UPI001375E9AD|nr:hypothetical protein [Dyadobacter flavalbus]